MTKRIIGIDVARALAIIGMIIVHFKIVFGDQGSQILKTFANFFDGKAAATFVVLAGVGIALMTNSSISDTPKLAIARKRIMKRAVFLFFVGLSYLWIWPADILHSYGVYMIFIVFLLHRSSTLLLGVTSVLMVLFSLLLFVFDYELGWDFSTMNYIDLWTIKGFLRNLFYNGYNPVFPWLAFMVFGLWYGRQNLNDHSFLKQSFTIGLIVFLLVQLVSKALIYWVSGMETIVLEDIMFAIGTDPMPPTLLFMLNGLSLAVTVISGCIIISKKYKSNVVIKSLYKTGKLALTFYVAHVIIGITFIEEFGTKTLGNYSIEFSMFYAFAFSLSCVGFAWLWLKYFNAGPLEWLMRKLTD